MRKPFLSVIGLALLLLAACNNERPLREGKGGPALWKIEKGKQTGFVFGTIHVLPADVVWETPMLRRAMEQSDRLVLEAEGLDDIKGTQRIFDDLGQSAGLPPMADRLPAAQRPALQALMARGGVSTTELSRYESWAAALQLATIAQSDKHVSGEQGVEPALTKAFRSVNKPVLGLETISDQFSLFDRLPDDVQQRLLLDTVEHADEEDDSYDRMLRAWLAGDMTAIARDFVAELAPEPALAKPLLIDRNRAWAARIPRLQGRPFIAVGAAHLAGPGNLLSLLERDGYTVMKIQ